MTEPENELEKSPSLSVSPDQTSQNSQIARLKQLETRLSDPEDDLSDDEVEELYRLRDQFGELLKFEQDDSKEED